MWNQKNSANKNHKAIIFDKDGLAPFYLQWTEKGLRSFLHVQEVGKNTKRSLGIIKDTKTKTTMELFPRQSPHEVTFLWNSIGSLTQFEFNLAQEGAAECSTSTEAERCYNRCRLLSVWLNEWCSRLPSGVHYHLLILLVSITSPCAALKQSSPYLDHDHLQNWKSKVKLVFKQIW